MKHTRIKDIAERANVSIGTVDRVLHDRGEVAHKTREKILAIAKSLNYQPNILAQALTTKKKYKVDVLMPKGGKDNIYWMSHPKGIEKAVHDLHPFLVNIEYCLFDLHNENDFLKKTRNIIENLPDGVIIAPILKKEALHFCKQLDDLNIPYVFIDTFLEKTNCISFIGEDAFQGGRVAASLIDFGLPPEKDILIVNIARNLENTQHLNRRNQGFLSYFFDAGKNHGIKISVDIPGAEKEIVEKKMDQVLSNNPNIGAILVSSSKTHIIASYVERKNLNEIILVGYETTRKNTNYLKKGIIQFLIGQKPMEQSEKAVKRMFEYLTSHTISLKHEFQPVEIINTENIIMY